ncbi:MAG: tetratricopeptide repeat protein [Betaproteobacteria bacterium]|nr:tetratricopeptide repeat protein [Betaproteobacteria bacterium]
MKVTIDQALKKAVDAHRARRFREAESLYRAILSAQPKHPDANHNLGVLAVEVGKPHKALTDLKIALDADRRKTRFWVSYIDALIQAKQVSEASDLLQQAKSIGLADLIPNLVRV